MQCPGLGRGDNPGSTDTGGTSSQGGAGGINTNGGNPGNNGITGSSGSGGGGRFGGGGSGYVALSVINGSTTPGIPGQFINSGNDQITISWTTATPTTTPTATPGARATTTTLTVTPSGPLSQGTVATLKATVTPSAAGTVQFKDGTTNLGGPVTVSVSNGTASKNVGAARVGSHTLTAVFTPTPTNPPAFLPSTSTPVTRTVTGFSFLNGAFVNVFTLIGMTPL